MKGRPFRATLSAAAVILSTSGGTSPVHAQSAEQLALHWVRGEGAEGCIDGAALARSLERRLGRPVFGPASLADAWLEGTVRARPEGGFVADLRWVETDGGAAANATPQPSRGARTLRSDAPTCDELSEAVTLVLAVMIDPEAALRDPEPPEPTPEPAEAPKAEAPPPEPTPPKAATPTPAKNALGAVALVGLGQLPTAQVGLGALYARDLPRDVQLRVEAVAYGQQRREIEDQGAEVELQPLSLRTSACPLLLRRGGVRLSLCGGVQAGLLLQSTQGLADNRDQPLGTLGLRVGPRLAWEGPRVRLSVGAAFVGALLRQRLYVRDEARATDVDVFVQDTFGADLDAAIAVRF